MDAAFSALTSAASGIQANLRGLQQTAHEIATASARGEEPIELVDSLVDALVQQRALEASANVMRRVDEAIGSIIDTFA